MMTKEWLSADRPHFYFLCAVFLVAAVYLFLRLNFLPLVMSTDSFTYIESAQELTGGVGAPHPERFLKPLGPLGIALFAQLFHGNYLMGFLVLNIVCYFLFGIAAWYFFREFFRDNAAAFYGTLILLSAYPVLKYGLDLYTDLGSWLFYLVALTGVIAYARTPTRRTLVLTSLSIAVGLLWKEYSVLAGCALGLVLLTQPNVSVTERFSRVGVLALTVLLIYGVVQFIVYAKFNFTYLDWYRIGAMGMTSGSTEYSPWFIGKSLFAVSLLGWVFAFLGLMRLGRLSHEDQRILLWFALPLLAIFFWGYVSSRLYFVVAPLGALLAVHGLMTYIESKTYRILAVSAVVLVNFAWLFTSDSLRPLLSSIL